MQSPKFMFYVNANDKVLSFSKNILLSNDDKIKYNEMHITQLIIHPKLKKTILLLNDDNAYHTSLSVNIENFNENKCSHGADNYTLKLLNMMHPYNYCGLCSSKIIDSSSVVLNGDNVELKFNVDINHDQLSYFTENVSDKKEHQFDVDETLIEFELFFK